MNLKIIVGAIVVFLILIMGALAWFTVLQPSVSTPTPNAPVATPPSFSDTVQSLYDDTDSNFNSGYQAMLRGNLTEAITFYKAALAEETDPTRVAHIKYRLARATEGVDPVEAIRLYKEIADDPSYPDSQKKYAVMWVAIMLMDGVQRDPNMLEEAQKGQPYSDFGDRLNQTISGYFEHSLTFGSTGVADFAVAESLAKDLRDGVITGTEARDEARARIAELMQNGRAYIEEARTDTRNAALLPRVYRGQARANALIAKLGDQNALDSYDAVFIEAITQGLASKLDGAIRWDYFRYSYGLNGVASFEKTQSHLDFLLNNLDTYYGIRDYLIAERNDIRGQKQQIVEYANANATLKRKLFELGWTEADFQN